MIATKARKLTLSVWPTTLYNLFPRGRINRPAKTISVKWSIAQLQEELRQGWATVSYNALMRWWISNVHKKCSMHLNCYYQYAYNNTLKLFEIIVYCPEKDCMVWIWIISPPSLEWKLALQHCIVAKALKGEAEQSTRGTLWSFTFSVLERKLPIEWRGCPENGIKFLIAIHLTKN